MVLWIYTSKNQNGRLIKIGVLLSSFPAESKLRLVVVAPLALPLVGHVRVAHVHEPCSTDSHQIPNRGICMAKVLGHNPAPFLGVAWALGGVDYAAVFYF